MSDPVTNLTVTAEGTALRARWTKPLNAVRNLRPIVDGVIWDGLKGRPQLTIKAGSDTALLPNLADKPHTIVIRAVAADANWTPSDSDPVTYTPAVAPTIRPDQLVQKWSIGAENATATDPMGMAYSIENVGFAGLAKSAVAIHKEQGCEVMIQNPGGREGGDDKYRIDQLNTAQRLLNKPGFVDDFMAAFKIARGIPLSMYSGTLFCSSLPKDMRPSDYVATTDGILAPYTYNTRRFAGDGFGSYEDGTREADYCYSKIATGQLEVITEGYSANREWLKGHKQPPWTYATPWYWNYMAVKDLKPGPNANGLMDTALVGGLYIAVEPYFKTDLWSPLGAPASDLTWLPWHVRILKEGLAWQARNNRPVKFAGDVVKIKRAMQELAA